MFLDPIRLILISFSYWFKPYRALHFVKVPAAGSLIWLSNALIQLPSTLK